MSIINVKCSVKNDELICQSDQSDFDEVVFEINADNICMEFSYGFWGIKRNHVEKLLEALNNNGKYELLFSPGSNQVSDISTLNGYTFFSGFGAGGNNPVSHLVRIPNCHCLPAFEYLLSKLK